jgi:hypothetical protein
VHRNKPTILQKSTKRAFAYDLGSAFDVKISQRLDLRLLQIDYFHAGNNLSGQSDLKLSTGIGIKFSK